MMDSIHMVPVLNDIHGHLHITIFMRATEHVALS
jgi:hypothetical protein